MHPHPFILLLLLVALLLCPAVSARAAQRPHFVLFIADDLSWHDVGPYGNGDVRTPNLDRLAGESLKFNLAFAPSPTCTPSRSAIYSGLYPMRNGAHANHSFVHPGTKTMPVYLKELGYRVVLAGKTHVGPRPLFPFEYLENSNVRPPGKDHVLWTDLGVEAIDRLLAEHDPSQPLALVVAAHSPHVYWPENQGYEPSKLKLPPYFLDTPQTRVALSRYYTDVTQLDKEVGQVRASLEKHGYADRTLFAFTSDQGAQFPFAKWSLYDAGIRVPLLIHWPGKIKSPGAATDAMVSLIDLLPTMIEAAGGTPPQEIDGKSFLRVLSGEADRRHDQIYAAHTGDKEMNQAPMRCVRTAKHKYVQNLRPDIRYKTHVSAAEEADGRGYWNSWVKLAETNPAAAKVVERFENKPAEELYDVEADPFELNNLADDPAHANVLAELREKVKQWRLQQGEDLDKAPMPDDAHLGNPRYAG